LYKSNSVQLNRGIIESLDVHRRGSSERQSFHLNVKRRAAKKKSGKEKERQKSENRSEAELENVDESLGGTENVRSGRSSRVRRGHHRYNRAAHREWV